MERGRGGYETPGGKGGRPHALRPEGKGGFMKHPEGKGPASRFESGGEGGVMKHPEGKGDGQKLLVKIVFEKKMCLPFQRSYWSGQQQIDLKGYSLGSK